MARTMPGEGHFQDCINMCYVIADSTVYGPLRQSCIDAHLKIIETAELLMDLWKRAEAQGSTPEIDAEILTLADKIGKMSFNWCRFVRRPGGLPQAMLCLKQSTFILGLYMSVYGCVPIFV